jgi:hypothetical protein
MAYVVGMLDGVAAGRTAAARLAATGQVKFGPGLTDAEINRIEAEFAFEFAADHRAFLATGLPLDAPARYPLGIKPSSRWVGRQPTHTRELLGYVFSAATPQALQPHGSMRTGRQRCGWDHATRTGLPLATAARPERRWFERSVVVRGAV